MSRFYPSVILMLTDGLNLDIRKIKDVDIIKLI